MIHKILVCVYFSIFLIQNSFSQETTFRKKDLQIDGVVLLAGDPDGLRTDFINDELLFENAMLKWQGLHPESKRFQRLKHSTLMNHHLRGFRRNEIELTEENVSTTFKYFEKHFETNLEKNDTLWIEIFGHGIPWAFMANANQKIQVIPYEALFIDIVKHFKSKNVIIHSSSCFSGSLILAARHSRALKKFEGSLKIVTNSHPELLVVGLPVEKTFFTYTRATLPNYYFFSALAGQFPDGEEINLASFAGSTHIEKAFHYLKSISGVGDFSRAIPVRGSYSPFVPTGSETDFVHFPQYFAFGDKNFDFQPAKRPLNDYYLEDQSWTQEAMGLSNQINPHGTLGAQLFRLVYKNDPFTEKSLETLSSMYSETTDLELKKEIANLEKAILQLTDLLPAKSKWLTIAPVK